MQHDRKTVGLDNIVFRGRLRQPRRLVEPQRSFDVNRRQVPIPKAKPPLPVPAAVVVIKPQPFPQPAREKRQHSNVLARQVASTPQSAQLFVQEPSSKRRSSGLQLGLLAMACFIFSLGLFVALQTLQTNHNANAQVAALAHSSTNASETGTANKAEAVPSTTEPSATTIADYTVPADQPRYLSIPEIGVSKAIILNLGILQSGALATPPNVFETGWYNQSAKPGQQGAMLIDGHVSSWTTNGVFYGLKDLKPGDTMQVQTGAGKIYTYRVMASQTYPSTKVDMQAALTPISPGKPGLNLITCDGQVEAGTSQFNERIIVFTEQI